MEKIAIAVAAKSNINKYFLVGVSGLLISFIGMLPFGTLNITAFNIAASQNSTEALLFSFAAVFVELIIVRLTLLGNMKITFNGRLTLYLMPLAALLLFYLAVSSFMTLGEQQQLSVNTVLFPAIQSSILLGFLLSALNPLHAPFWIGWNRVLISNNILDKKKMKSYASYMIGIGSGTLGALLIFIFLGKNIFQNHQQYGALIAFIMGCLYLGFSIYLIFLTYKKYLKLKTA